MPRACTTISGEEIKAWLREIRIERLLLTAQKSCDPFVAKPR